GVHTLWNLPPGPGREEAVRRTLLHGGGLGDPTWMHRVLDETYRRTTELTRWGYRVPGARRSATPALAHLDGARYLRLLRR
ncbi:pyridine nucleotide-disulfide oxidoreductase, partial [Mycobacterium tuberculosis]|nr:pyridine nucleotide-disulfide oxidoreductase [Mycobacterium tuberculosis]